MAIDTSVPRSRRALLAGGIGGLAALVASALGRPLPVRGASGSFDSAAFDTPAVSGTNTATSGLPADGVWGRSASTLGTGVHGYAAASSGSTRGIWGESNSTDGTGVYGYASKGSGETLGVWGQSVSMSGTGVMGVASAPSGSTRGVLGRVASPDGTGVIGFSGAGDIPTPVAKTGVYGYATHDSGSRGVHGRSTAGRGVYGQATSGLGVRGYATSGVGVSAEATTGYAIRSSGRLRLDKASGIATILAGNSSDLVEPDLDLTSASLVLLTPKGDLGDRRLWYTTNTTANTFTIRVSSAVAADLRVGWLLLG